MDLGRHCEFTDIHTHTELSLDLSEKLWAVKSPAELSTRGMSPEDVTEWFGFEGPLKIILELLLWAGIIYNIIPMRTHVPHPDTCSYCCTLWWNLINWWEVPHYHSCSVTSAVTPSPHAKTKGQVLEQRLSQWLTEWKIWDPAVEWKNTQKFAL